MAKGECNCGAVQFGDRRGPLGCLCVPLLDLPQVHGEQRHRGGCRSERTVPLGAGQERIATWKKPNADWQTWFCDVCGARVPGENDADQDVRAGWFHYAGRRRAQGHPPHLGRLEGRLGRNRGRRKHTRRRFGANLGNESIRNLVPLVSTQLHDSHVALAREAQGILRIRGDRLALHEQDEALARYRLGNLDRGRSVDATADDEGFALPGFRLEERYARDLRRRVGTACPAGLRPATMAAPRAPCPSRRP